MGIATANNTTRPSSSFVQICHTSQQTTMYMVSYRPISRKLCMDSQLDDFNMAEEQEPVNVNKDGNDFQGLMKVYKEWAPTYDEDVKKYRGYIGPEVGAKVLAKELQQSGFAETCKILDVGSGTGLVAETLKTLNFTNIDALDSSVESLEVAREKCLYNNLIVGILGPQKHVEAIKDNTYDAAIAIGLFTKNHLKAEGAMEEIVRVVRPGGLICFSIREDVMFDKSYGYEETMAELLQKKAWELVSKNQEQYHTLKDYLNCFMFIYKVI